MNLDALSLPDSQKAQVRSALQKHGYSEDDFDWVHTGPNYTTGEERLPGAEMLYLTHIATGFRRMYDISTWAEQFEEDFKNQVFKVKA
jgi:hypothetical protein